MASVRPIALYVHWPWCVRKCPYCDFNSHALTSTVNESLYIDALACDLDAALTFAAGRPLSSVFFGGGTPSLISEAGFARIMNEIARRFSFVDGAEITLEANPGTHESARFASYVESGVNRFSLGIQSFNARLLQRLGRIHTAAEAKKAVETVSGLVGNFNLDVMYALPSQSVEEALSDARQAIDSGATHLSFYELMIEEGTAFAKRIPGELPDSDTAADIAEAVSSTIVEAGFERYEISGYAKPGFRCHHNLTYWTFGDYLGIGAGAHGKITTEGGIVRTERRANPVLYADDAAAGRFVSQTSTVLAQNLPFEFMLNVLRLHDGVQASRWEETTGIELCYIEDKLKALRAEGLLVNDPGLIRTTELGRRFLSDVQERFLPEDEADI